MKRILLIDTASEILGQKSSIDNADYEVESASTCIDAQSIISKKIVELVIMEIDLPDGNGFALCRNFKSHEIWQFIPVIFLTHRCDLSDRIQGFKAGADDYITKPFDRVELGLRIEARLRSIQLRSERDSVWVKEDLTLTVPFQKATLFEAGIFRDLKLTPTEFRLLYFFIKNENHILTRDQLLATVWYGDERVLSRTIDKHISTLKKKLGSRMSYIQSVHSRGYRFKISQNWGKSQVCASPIL